jgi:hypothetical protein
VRSLNGAAAWSIRAAVKGQYRRLTPEQRADHYETLAMLGRMVVILPTHRAVRRTFVVMSVALGL